MYSGHTGSVTAASAVTYEPHLGTGVSNPVSLYAAALSVLCSNHVLAGQQICRMD